VVLARGQAGPSDYVVFDLDPPDEPDGFEQAIQVRSSCAGCSTSWSYPAT